MDWDLVLSTSRPPSVHVEKQVICNELHSFRITYGNLQYRSSLSEWWNPLVGILFN